MARGRMQPALYIAAIDVTSVHSYTVVNSRTTIDVVFGNAIPAPARSLPSQSGVERTWTETPTPRKINNRTRQVRRPATARHA